MTGQLVIAELGAFRTVLRNATPVDSEKVRLWSRSTITNALHRVGPTEPMKDAAERASTEADAFAARLAQSGLSTHSMIQTRERALEALETLIATVRDNKPAGSRVC